MRRLISFVTLSLAAGIGPMAVAQPGPLITLQNSNLFFPAVTLTTNSVPGLTNQAPHLMVSSVSVASAPGGKVSLVNTQVWAQRYDGPGLYSFDELSQVTFDSAGNVIVTGESPGPGTDFDFVTIKYSADGTAVLTNRFNGSASQADSPEFVAVDGGNNIYVAGYSTTLEIGPDLTVIKYSSSGVPVWTNYYNSSGTNFDFPVGLAVDAAGNAFVAAGSFSSQGREFTTLKYDSLGNAVWTNHYGSPANGSAYPQALALDGSGNVFVAGHSDEVGMSLDYVTLKYDGNGTAVWTNRYHGSQDLVSGLTVDRAGNVIVTGDSFSAGPHLYVTVKYANDGTPLWTNIQTGPTYQGASLPRVTADLSGKVFITGGSPGVSSLGDFNIVKLTAAGIPLWTNRYIGFGTTNGWIAGTTTDSAGNFYLAGYSKPPGALDNDFVAAKFAPDGTALWTNRYNGPADLGDDAFSLAVDDAANVYVAGFSEGVFSSRDYATVKYADYISYTPPTNFFGTDSFTFTVVDNAGNSATSSVSVVVLPLSLQFNAGPTNLQFTPLGLQLQVDGAHGTNPVILCASSNLLDWKPIATNAPALGSAHFLDSAATSEPRRFYRAVQQR